MHEFSIARAIVGVVEDALDASVHRVAAVRLRVGSLASVVPAALVAAFPYAAAGTRLAGAEVRIDVVAAGGPCMACGDDVDLEPGSFRCPRCGGRLSAMRRGQELEVASVDVEREPVTTPLAGGDRDG